MKINVRKGKKINLLTLSAPSPVKNNYEMVKNLLGHPNSLNHFENGKSFPDKLFPKRFGTPTPIKGRGPKNRFFLGKSPKLWVGGGQES